MIPNSSNASPAQQFATVDFRDLLLQLDIQQLESDDTAKFAVLRHDTARVVPTKPLAVLIHPGDLIEQPATFRPEDREKVRAFYESNVLGTARDMQAWRALGCEFAVLHRSSCSQIRPDKTAAIKHLFAEVRRTWQDSTILHGDDLETAAAWMITNLQIATRPAIYLARRVQHASGRMPHIHRHRDRSSRRQPSKDRSVEARTPRKRPRTYLAAGPSQHRPLCRRTVIEQKAARPSPKGEETMGERAPMYMSGPANAVVNDSYTDGPTPYSADLAQYMQDGDVLVGKRRNGDVVFREQLFGDKWIPFDPK